MASDNIADRTSHLRVNGEAAQLAAHPKTPLLYALRNDLGLPGAKFGCGLGLCGACVVLVDGHPTPSCDLPLESAIGSEIVTVEGLGDADDPHPVQRAVLDEQAGQCGYCLTGMIMTASALLATNPSPTEAEIHEALDRHLCRCGIQNRVVRAILAASDEMAP